MSIRKFLLLIGVSFGLLVSMRAEAQTIPEGPFQNQKHLLHTWADFIPWQAAHVELDGQLVLDRFGFGPRAYAVYFTCPEDGLIRQNCPSEGPFQSVSAIVGYWSQVTPWQAAYIYADGQLVYQRFGFGPAIYRSYSWCRLSLGRAYMTNCTP